MGYTTDFIGHIDITPALNQDETEYLTAFSASRRFDRPGGPYAVPGNPYAEERPGDDVQRYNRVAPGQPQLYCQWEPCWDGCCLSFDGHEKFYEPVRWLRYLVDHFLKPGAKASESGLPEFEHFTFDHEVRGMVVGCRRDTKELFAIKAHGTRITTTVLRRGDVAYWDRPPLPYEEQLDREAARSRRRRRSTTGADSGVIDLAERRTTG
ncbi:MAG: hypothetical protein JWP82_2389 [Humibacillus sp.]|nr:hypothetical protein [Humibacillus sp.]